MSEAKFFKDVPGTNESEVDLTGGYIGEHTPKETAENRQELKASATKKILSQMTPEEIAALTSKPAEVEEAEELDQAA